MNKDIKPFDKVCNWVISGFAVGHVLNDMVAAIYFFYLLFYLNQIKKLSSAESGYVLLAGQIADAVTTPVAGIFSDRINTPIGKRMPLYIFGLIMIWIFYLPLFDVYGDIPSYISGGDSTNLSTIRTVFYAVCAGLFNVGWATLQIAHMSLIPQITLCEDKRNSLVGYRTSFTYISTIMVLIIALVIFQIIEDGALAFKLLAAISVCTGTVLSLYFLYQVREVTLSSYMNQNKERFKQHQREKEGDSFKPHGTFTDSVASLLAHDNDEKLVKWSAWMRFPIFYTFCMLYTSARVTMNVSMTLTPYYINRILGFQVDPNKPVNIYIATIPMVTYIFSTLAGFSYDKVIKYVNIKSLLSIVNLLGASSFVLLIVLGLNEDYRYWAYPLYGIIGIFLSYFLTGSTAVINDVVGEYGSSGAYVFGIYSLSDKLFNGLIIVIVSGYLDTGSNLFVNLVNGLIPTVSFLLGILFIYINVSKPVFNDLDFDENPNLITNKGNLKMIDERNESIL